MDSFDIAIVTVGYNRPDSMKMLLDSIVRASFPEQKIDLIISIDKGAKQSEIIEVANKISWEHGEKKIRAFTEKQGLRSHIIQCGDLADDYDAVIVLEDDLLVSPYFFYYVKQAVSFYYQDKKIAGISLYKHQIHPGVNRPFEPMHNGYDAYLMQFAQSWGQCWTRPMWREFKKWYLEHIDSDLSSGGILPEYVSHWNSQSWLKYYMRYIVETDKYYVYPMISLTTNASQVGEHCSIPNNDYQVSLLQGYMDFRFPQEEVSVKYDVYFERKDIEVFPELKGNIVLDLYGNRTNFANIDYLASIQNLPYKIIKNIQLKYRPMEMNCISPEDGVGIRIYDMHQKDTLNKKSNDLVTRYDVRSIHWKRVFHLGWTGFKDAVASHLQRGRK